MSPAPRVQRTLASMLFGPPAAMLAAHKPRTRLRNYPLNVRPLRGDRFMQWEYLGPCPGGQFDLWTFEVPRGKIAVINRFASCGNGATSFTLLIDGVADPVINEVGYFHGYPVYDYWKYDTFWSYRNVFIPLVAGNMLIDPVLADQGQEVRMRAVCYSLATADFAAGVSGFFCNRPEKWSMGR